MTKPHTAPGRGVTWAKVIDQEACIGCHACSTACKSENDVPLSVHRTYVKYVEVGRFPQARRAFQVTRCNQCDSAPCTEACPTSAMFRRPDGIVDFDKQICIGCKACIAACPYDAIFINPEDHSAEKCNFCAHRLDVGLEPACVVVCPTEAILVGDLNDPDSRVAALVHRHPVAVRRPEKDTRPKLFYRGAHQATLDPLAARRPDGGLFLWSEQGGGPRHVTSGSPGQGGSSAAALLAYDVPHATPWHWPVTLYTLAKGIASGVYMMAALLLLSGLLEPLHALWRSTVPLLAGTFLGLTGALLIADLEHPRRFYFIFTRPQWRSWLVRGAFLITAFSALLGIHLAAGWARHEPLLAGVAWPGLPLALLTAVYTAHLLAQAKARDLWQSPLLPPHLGVQALLAGAAVLLPVALLQAPELAPPLARWVAVLCALHLALVAGGATLAPVTAHARLAAWEMVRGRHRLAFWTGAALVAAGLATPWLGLPCALSALAGLLAYEHAFLQAGQSVPLA